MKKMSGQISETIALLDFDEIIVGLMFNLLRQSHPVKRVKVKKHFKRAVEVNGRTFLLPKDNYALFSILFSELETLYCAESDEITYVISQFYSIKG
jgi:hypothetical protein